MARLQAAEATPEAVEPVEVAVAVVVVAADDSDLARHQLVQQSNYFSSHECSC